MTALIRSELLKARSMPGTWCFLAVIVLMTALNTTLVLSDPEIDHATGAGVRSVFTAGRDFVVLFVALGAVAAATEFRHGTATRAFLNTPARHRVLVAKAAAFALVGMAIALIGVGIQLAIALPWLAENADAVTVLDAAVIEPAAASVLSGLLYAALGVALGTLLRNQVLAAGVAFGWFAVVENALAAFAPDVSRYLPGGLLSGTAADGLLVAPVALALLAAYAAALTVVTAATTLRRDV